MVLFTGGNETHYISGDGENVASATTTRVIHLETEEVFFSPRAILSVPRMPHLQRVDHRSWVDCV